MPLPAGVTTCTVTYGKALGPLGGEGAIDATLTMDRKVVHAATGWSIHPVTERVSPAGPGQELVFQVPHVDQDGMIDASGAGVKNWKYILTGNIRFQGQTLSFKKEFQVFVGQESIDLDLIPDGAAIPPATTSSVWAKEAQDAADAAAVSATAADASADAAASSATTATTAKTAAETAATNAAGSADAAATARDAAVTARTAAQGARDAAITARDAAETARTGAETAATAAAGSATAAQTAETNAEAAQGAAETARTGAETARAGAEEARTGAEEARTGAETARDEAEAAAATATAPTEAQVDARIAAQKAAPSGLAPLDGDSKLPEANVPDRLSEAGLTATFVAGHTVPPPTGGDDTAILTAALTGTRTVMFQPDALYLWPGGVDSFPDFSGRIIGNGATIQFTYAGTYNSAAIVQSWTDVEVDDLGFTGSPLAGALFGGACERLSFRHCRVFDLTTAFSNSIAADMAVQASRFFEVFAPVGVNQTVQGPHGGDFVVEDCDFNFAPTSPSGSLIGTITASPTPGARVFIRRNRMLTDDLPGYSIDAAIDIEPAGTTPYALVEVDNNTILNGSIYLTGGDQMFARRNQVRFTTNRGITSPAHPGMTAFVGYNSLGTFPDTGVVVVEDNDVIQDPVALAYETYLWVFSTPVKEWHSRNNRAQINSVSTGATEAYLVANTSERVVIDGDVVTGAGASTFTGRVAARLNFLPSEAFEIRNLRIDGSWFALVGSQTGSADTCKLLKVVENDLTDALFNGVAPSAANYIYNDTFGTFTKTRRAGNSVIDY